MPRSSASLLREFNSHPVVTYGSPAGYANYGITNQRPRQNAGEDVNVQIARGMLATEQGMDDDRRQRLQGMIQAADPEARKRAQAMAEYQTKKLIDAGADPNNQYTTQEFNEAFRQIQRNSLGAILPTPVQLWKQKAEHKDPDVALTNTAEAFAKQYGVPADLIAPMLSIDPKTKRLDSDSVHKTVKFLEDRGKADSTTQSAVKSYVKTLTDQMAEIEASGMLFDADGNQIPRPDHSWWSSDDDLGDRQTEYDRVLGIYNGLRKERDQAFGKMRGYAGIDQAAAPTTPPPPVARNQASAAKVPMFTADAPLTAKTDEELDKILPEIRERARRKDETIFVRLPSTGELFEIK